MRADLLFAAVAAAMAPKPKEIIAVVDQPSFTKNVFGPISEIAGKPLEVMERNPEGDCLCIFHGSKGIGLVDVDHRDIQPTKGATQL